MSLLLAAALLAGLTGPARADAVDDLLAQAREAAAQMPAPAAAAASAGVLAGPRTWVFAAGVLEFEDEQYTPYPADNRRDARLVERFASLGVPRDHITAVYDADATLYTVRRSLKEMLAKTQPGDLLFLYYTGHSFRSGGALYLANYDAGYLDPSTSWSMASILGDIEMDFKGSRAVLATDGCYSGLVAKQAAAAAKRVAYGVVSPTDEFTITAMDWIFTDALLSALDGDPAYDADRDGVITFAELGRGVEWVMSDKHEQQAVISTAGGFDPKLKVASVRVPKAP